MYKNPRQLPIWMTVSAPLTIVGLNLYWWLAFAGPFRWCAELQIKHSNGYQVQTTLLVTMLVTTVPTVVLLLILARLGCFDRFATEADRAGRRRPWFDWCMNHLGMLVGIALAIGLVVAGQWKVIEGRMVGPLTRIDAAQLEAKGAPPSRWADVSGRFLGGWEMKEVSRGFERSRYHYYPLVSTKWKPGDPVAVVAKIPWYLVERMNLDKPRFDFDRWMERVKAESQGFVRPGDPWPEPQREDRRDRELDGLKQGMLSRNDLPGIVMTGMTQSGFRLTDPYYVLDSGATPETEANTGRILMGLGLAVGLITGIASGVSAWRVQRNTGRDAKTATWDASTADGSFTTGDAAAAHVKLGGDGSDGIMIFDDGPMRPPLVHRRGDILLPPAVGWGIFIGFLAAALALVVWLALRN
jgi:hypothetical protein